MMSISFIRHQNGLPDMLLPADVYCEDMKRRMQSIIGLVESICYMYEGGKDKSLWNEYTFSQFQSFRKLMLDFADEMRDVEKNIVFEKEEEDESSECTKKTGDIISSFFGRKSQKG